MKNPYVADDIEYLLKQFNTLVDGFNDLVAKDDQELSNYLTTLRDSMNERYSREDFNQGTIEPYYISALTEEIDELFSMLSYECENSDLDTQGPYDKACEIRREVNRRYHVINLD